MSLFDEIRRRRVPQTLVGYVLGLWGGAQVIDFVEQRYGLSPYWVELFVVGYLILLPAVIAVAWNKGAPERQKWSRLGASAVVLNVVVAIVVLSIGGSVRDLRAVTQTVVIETEEGETVEREVPREAFRKSVTMSFPLAPEMDPEARAVAADVEYLLETDLVQNPFLSVRSAWLENARAERAGLEDATSMPRALVHESARNADVDVFLVGRVEPVENGWSFALELLETEDGRPVDSREFNGTDVFTLADEMGIWMREALEVPEHDSGNLPVADLTTESPEALRALTEGSRALHFDSNFPRATELFQRAVEIDPTFALGHLAVYQATAMNGRMDLAVPAIDEAMKHSYRLNERTEFLVRASYYGARNDAEKALAVLEMWATVLPDDPAAWQMLVNNYSIVRDVDKTLSAIEKMLDGRPDDVASLQLAIEAAVRVGEHEAALRSAATWVELTPNETAPLVRLARLQIDVGDLDAAAATAERTLLLDPTNVATRHIMASVHRRRGEFGAARSIYEDLARPDGPEFDRLEAVTELIRLERRLGRIDASVERIEEWEAVAEPVLPASQFQVRLSTFFDVYVDDRRPDYAEQRLADLRATSTEPGLSLLALGGVEVALALEDAEAAAQELDALEQAVETWNIGLLRPQVQYLRVRERLLAGDPAGALAASDSLLALDSTAHHVGRYRALALREMGRLDEALEQVDWHLKGDRAQPWALRTRAQVLASLGRTDDAIAAYEAALAVWSDPDPDYAVAARARRELEELRRGS